MFTALGSQSAAVLQGQMACFCRYPVVFSLFQVIFSGDNRTGPFKPLDILNSQPVTWTT